MFSKVLYNSPAIPRAPQLSSYLILEPASLGPSWLLLPAPRAAFLAGHYWLLLAPRGPSWLPLASPGSSQLLLAPPGSCWLLLV